MEPIGTRQFLGLSLKEAEELAGKVGFVVRVVKMEGEARVGTCDYYSDRLNVSIENGLVVKVDIG